MLNSLNDDCFSRAANECRCTISCVAVRGASLLCETAESGEVPPKSSAGIIFLHSEFTFDENDKKVTI